MAKGTQGAPGMLLGMLRKDMYNVEGIPGVAMAAQMWGGQVDQVTSEL